MEKIIFGIVLFHIILGFGWIVYKLQFQKSNDEKKSTQKNTSEVEKNHLKK